MRDGGPTLHDAFGNIWNWTKCFPEVAAALNEADRARDPALLVQPIGAWLRREQPLREASTAGGELGCGEPLLCAHLVEIDRASGVVRRVVATAS